jgi:hypothetical protein
MQNYAENIITGLEKNWNKDEEAQLDFIVEELKNVPAEEHEEVMYRCAAYMTLSRTAKVTDWFAEAEEEEAKADARFVEMNERDWRDAQQVAKRQRWFGSWDRWVTWARRVDGKRRVKAAAMRIVKKEVDKVSQLIEERRDVQRYPHSYGSAEDCSRLIGQYEQAICSLPAGKWRLALEKQEESKALQPRMDEIVRQVKMTIALKETLAAKRIQTVWRSRSVVDEDEDYDDGNQPPRAKDIVRRTHDDGFDDDYCPADDEGEETASQEEERRQEMAEERERQAETYEECCDGICCECDHGQYDRQPAGRWAEQVDPLGRTFGQAWKEFGAAIERENERVRALNGGDEVVKRELGSAAWRRSIFEHNSVPTSDPNIRVSHDVSHPLPDN